MTAISRGNSELTAEQLEDLMVGCAAVFAGLLQTCGNNRARQREKLGALLEEMAHLQEVVRFYLFFEIESVDIPWWGGGRGVLNRFVILCSGSC